MPRVAKNIKTLTSKDREMLRAFANVGYITPDRLTYTLGQADKRISGFEKDKYIERVTYLNRTTKNTEYAYRLTSKGRDLCQKELGLKHLYCSNSVQHDIVLANKYFACNQEQRASWITESEWRERFENHIEKLKDTNFGQYTELYQRWYDNSDKTLSPPDGGYVIEERLIAVEIVTKNYRNEDIAAKIEFTRILETVYIQSRA